MLTSATAPAVYLVLFCCARHRGTRKRQIIALTSRSNSIVANQAITGHVSTQISPGNRVVVYVHTNRWYIHPYAGQGDGLSWASIKPNGSWKLKTVKREFDANQVGAFVIPAGAPIPDALTAPDVDLSPTASCVRVLLNPDGKNDPDYGKL